MSNQRITDVGFTKNASSIFVNDNGKFRQATVDDLVSVLDIQNKAHVIVNEKSGESIAATDSSGDKLRGLNVYGKSKQRTTTGKNQLEIRVASQTINGITFAVNPDKSITANGTATEDAVLIINDNQGTFLLEKNIEYILSGCPTGGSSTKYRLQIYNYDGKNTTKVEFGEGATFKFTNENNSGYISASIIIKSGVTVSNLVFKPMVRLATITDATYEPYTGGKASPSPDFLQTVENCENTEVSVRGFQLFDASRIPTTSQSGATVTNNGDGSFTVSGSGNLTGSFGYVYKYNHEDTISMIKSGTLTLLTEAATNPFVYVQFLLNNKIVADVSNSVVASKFCNITQDMLNDETFRSEIGFYASTSNAIKTGTIKPMLYQDGDGAWEPFTQQSLTIPNTLCGIPVSSGGNYTDENGQMWVCDEVDMERGVYVQRVYTKIFNGSEEWFVSDNAASGQTYRITLNRGIVLNPDEKMLFCTHAESISYNHSWDIDVFASMAYSNVFVFKDSNITTLEEWKTFLSNQYASGTPVTVQYIISTPVETPLTAEQIAAYKALHSNYPNTTVLNNNGAGMKLKYSADTKHYIDNLEAKHKADVETLKTAIIALGGNV